MSDFFIQACTSAVNLRGNDVKVPYARVTEWRWQQLRMR